MFEKEASDIAKDIYIHHFDDDINYPEVLNAITVGVQKGIEFGYNKANEWHDLRKNPDDLPKRDERFSTNVSIAVMTQDNNFAFYCFDDKKWYFQGVEIGNVIAWCEVPKFAEVEELLDGK